MYRLLIALLIASTTLLSADARQRISDRPPKEHRTTRNSNDRWLQSMRGHLPVDAYNADSLCLPLDSVIYSGFDKPASAEKESFIITNHARLPLVGIEIEISYFSTDSRLIHRRLIRQQCLVPTGESRKTDIRSFDTVHSYHFFRSTAGRNGAIPFTVSFRTIRLWYMTP